MGGDFLYSKGSWKVGPTKKGRSNFACPEPRATCYWFWGTQLVWTCWLVVVRAEGRWPCLGLAGRGSSSSCPSSFCQPLLVLKDSKKSRQPFANRHPPRKTQRKYAKQENSSRVALKVDGLEAWGLLGSSRRPHQGGFLKGFD